MFSVIHLANGKSARSMDLPDLHPNGVHRGSRAGEIDKDLRNRCREYYLQHYGTEEDFRREFFYTS